MTYIYKTKYYNKEKAREYYIANKGKCIKRAITRKKTKLMRRRYWLDKWKIRKGCKDCGYNKYAVALEFDHINLEQKVQTVGYLLLRSSIKTLFTEIRKCDLVCRNCHTIRTEITKGHETNIKRYTARWNMLQTNEAPANRFYYSQ